MASVEHRGNGTWRIIASGGYGADGRQIRIRRTIHLDPQMTLKAQRREAERQAGELETDYNRKAIAEGKRVTVAALSEEYLATMTRKGLSGNTLRGYEGIHSRWIVPFLGKASVQDVDPRMINRFLNKIAGEPKKRHYKNGTRPEPDAKPISGTMQKKVYQQLHALLDYAMQNGILASNPADRVTPPRKDTQEARILEIDELKTLLCGVEELKDPQWRAVFSLLIFSGMRPSELCGLNWEDLRGTVLTVRAGAFKPKGGKPTERTSRPKTRSSVRDIILSEDVVNALEAHRAAQDELKEAAGKDWPDRETMFHNSKGHRIDLCAVQSRWSYLCKKLNLPKTGIYSLRHSAASLMILEGLSVRDVASRLGHASPALVLSTYSHSFMDANERATAAITAALKKVKRGEG